MEPAPEGRGHLTHGAAGRPQTTRTIISDGTMLPVESESHSWDTSGTMTIGQKLPDLTPCHYKTLMYMGHYAGLIFLWDLKFEAKLGFALVILEPEE